MFGGATAEFFGRRCCSEITWVTKRKTSPDFLKACHMVLDQSGEVGQPLQANQSHCHGTHSCAATTAPAGNRGIDRRTRCCLGGSVVDLVIQPWCKPLIIAVHQSGIDAVDGPPPARECLIREA